MENSSVSEPDMAPLFGSTVTCETPSTAAFDRGLAMSQARGIVDVVSPYVAPAKPAEVADHTPDYAPAPGMVMGRR